MTCCTPRKEQIMEKELFYEKKSFYKTFTKAEVDAAHKYAVGYMKYLDAAKTEREAVSYSIDLAKAEGVELTPDQLDAVAGGLCDSFWDTVNSGCDYHCS